MKILGIDPGTTESGYVVLEVESKKIINKGVVDNEELLDKIEYFDVEHIGIEMIASYGMPVGKTTFNTVLWIGRFYEKSILNSNIIAPHLLYKKTNINPAICFNSKAKDANIRQSLIDMFDGTGGGKIPQVGIKSSPGPLFGISTHMWAALAVAVTIGLKMGFNRDAQTL